MSFKIIAIRPLEKCSKKFIKNLEPDVFYTLYNEYKITPSKQESQIEIFFNRVVPIDLYHTGKMNVNISAIVGKNGSGKSSIIELLYAALYNVSLKYKFIVRQPQTPKKQFSIDDYNFDEIDTNIATYNLGKPNMAHIAKLSGDISMLENLQVEIEADLRSKVTPVDFNRQLPLEFDRSLILDIDNLNWHEHSLEVITAQLNQLRKYKLDLERHFKIRYDIPVEDLQYIDGLMVQVIFEVDKEIYVLNVKGREIYIRQLSLINSDGNHFEYVLKEDNTVDKFQTLKRNSSLFYSIVNNYSLYGLNSLEVGEWINKIFHKNDGYQTPIVINPMRIDGTIDVNKENYLSKSRLLSNVLSKVEKEEEIKQSPRCLVNEKVADLLILKLNQEKFVEYSGKVNLEYNDLKIVLHKVFNAFKNSPEEPDFDESDIARRFDKPTIVEQYAMEYIFRKIHKIASNYKIQTRKYGKSFDIRRGSILDSILEELHTDFSHITFKLRQAINFLKYNYDSFDKSKLEQKIPISLLSNEINNKIDKLTEADLSHAQEVFIKGKAEGHHKKDEDFKYVKPAKFDLINFLPPSFFDIDIQFGDGKGFFSDMSSGEKQRVYGITSIIYHLLNLKSIEPVGQVKYDYFNIILDEIELYFHPDFQKTFISDLLKSISGTGKTFAGINIIFITHSPFILSDIPHPNILFLEDGKPKKKDMYRTFGANIHDLLADSFFMPNGYIGKFAQEEIEKTIEWVHKHYLYMSENINDEKYESLIHSIDSAERYRHKQIIELIDEPVLKNKLLDMYKRIFSHGQDKERDIANLIQEAKRLGFEIVISEKE